MPGAFFRVLRVDQQNRIRIPGDIRKEISWLEELQVECELAIGMYAVVMTVLKEDPPAQVEALQGDQPVDWDQLRYLATETAWQVPLSFESKQDRYTLHLPAELRKLGALPDHPSNLVVLGIWDRVLLWKPEDWLKFTRTGLRGRDDLQPD